MDSKAILEVYVCIGPTFIGDIILNPVSILKEDDEFFYLESGDKVSKKLIESIGGNIAVYPNQLGAYITTFLEHADHDAIRVASNKLLIEASKTYLEKYGKGA